MFGSPKRNWACSTALASLILGTTVVSSPAKAVTVNSFGSPVVDSFLTVCRVRVPISLTGDTNDGNPNVPSPFDRYAFGFGTAVGPALAGGGIAITSISVGQTSAFTLAEGLDPSAGRGDYFFAVYDTGPGGNFSNPGPIAGSVPIPRSSIIAAGGNCAQIASNTAPVADAGPDQTLQTGGGAVSLDASNSIDADNDPLSFSWTQVSGPSVSLTGANTATPGFAAPAQINQQQDFVFELTLSDGLETVTDRVAISIAAGPNTAPVVDAGPDQTITGGASVSLVGTANDNDNDPLTYQWTQTGGPAVTLTGATTLTPNFTAPPRTASQQTVSFNLVANDGAANSTPDSVDIIIPANQTPVANGGSAQNVAGGATVSLDGSASLDPDGDSLVYIWTQTSGPSVVLTGANTVTPSFVAPASISNTQTVQFQLTVADPFDASDVSTVDVTVAANQQPIADAGPDQSVTGNSGVTLDGSGSSDPEGDPINYNWVQTGGPSVTLNNATSVSPSFTAPTSISAAQTLTFQLTVNDNPGSSNPGGNRVGGSIPNLVAPPNAQQDSVDITILANRPPIADAGVDQGPIDSGQNVTLDGSASSDPDGDNLTYSWTQVSGTPVSLTGGNAVAPTFIAPLVNGSEDLLFALVVNDGQTSSVADTVTIGIRAVGTITVIQQVIGSDTSIAFTSDVTALNANIVTSGGTGQLSASNVSAGSHSLVAADLSSAGYAVTDISCNDSDSVVSLASRSVAINLSPNEDLVCTFSMANSREAASAAISNFLTGRNALILAHQPDLQRRLDRLNGNPASAGSANAYGLPVPGSGNLPFNLNLAGGNSRFATSMATIGSATGEPDRGSQPFDIWAEAYFSRARIGEQSGSFSIFYIGADYRVSDSLLIGALAEVDDFKDRDTLRAGEAEGKGWMAGPYLTAKLAPDLYAELRAAWGASDNSVSPLGTYTDNFDTSRSYYSGSLIGQFDLGKKTTLRPEVTIRHISEKQKTYTDGLNITIPSQTVDQGDISFKPRLSHTIQHEDGWSLRPYGEVEGIYTFGANQGVLVANLNPNAGTRSLDDFRMRVEGGFDFFSPGSFRASLSAFHDGIGNNSLRSTGIHIGVSFGI